MVIKMNWYSFSQRTLQPGNGGVNAAGALDYDFKTPRDRPLAFNAWLLDVFHRLTCDQIEYVIIVTNVSKSDCREPVGKHSTFQSDQF